MEKRADPSESKLEELASATADRLPRMLDDVTRLLRHDWPDYADFIVTERDEVLVAASIFLHRLVRMAKWDITELSELSEAPDQQPDQLGEQSVFEEIGRAQWQQGRDLTSLLSAYQIGARVAWHHVAEVALEVGVSPDVFASLAEAVFIFVDQLSSASARGYVLEQSEAAAARERLRDELGGMLLSDRSDTAAIRAAAARVDWPLPREAAVVLVEPDNPVGTALLARLDHSCLHVRRQRTVCAIIPDPNGPQRRQRLSVALRGAGAVVGHAVPLENLPASMRVAEVAAQLRHAGVLGDDPVFVDEHLDSIIVHRDPRLLDAFRTQCLAPLDALGPVTRQRLCETLASWLRHLGDRRAVAEELHIHPQTVRYRLSQLRELFGERLDDPDNRRRLTLALAWGDPSPAR
ncbi:helix-turn-helix domain-containing protein [Amycolatopsis cynarae]|uniref:Helix-turn-helix domain-containing protein n=1 Tax=Amycolatopsis cynarae TaxID=2995223 RepID=A0ABY7ATH5_9PSEU|nr:helix-turn-helix domain-containing protein [Amycolatopsis sp. HUAS 11-8]WAL63042.1 helix-turn-helix domain-containing protein [Amycolatopsis sp. HUAS 11-8]